MNKLRSESVSNILSIILKITIVLASVALINTALFDAAPEFYEYLFRFDQVVILLLTFLYYILLVLYLIWVYKVHVDFNNLFLDYPITPGKAVGFYFIPIFNFYWLFNIPMKISNKLKHDPVTADDGKRFSAMWPFAMGLYFIDSFIDNYMFKANPLDITNELLLASDLVFLTLLILSFLLLKAVTNSLQQLKASKEDLEQQPEEEPSLKA
ncbi:DUF4328 domain-containing protein [Halalkalibacterium halodurans]|uniref:BH2929 protein n=1 Tax=Halalkalibacterium halodurans (strain ATCC BAA-125 / DSM 18197 / FERM 7344 / JCM 9153 / C-125) TaxID=272558 RepID=Q9K8S4_HALH5|nr:DUF4328 domain-containing protein [Halalkalibacterium halodurans]MED4174667.1 DUF4328 domain-containing protein [Halalkalibacterium halodurans]BAB06648.1 BH2929 [Halalkalibacterium halodurans C-125]